MKPSILNFRVMLSLEGAWKFVLDGLKCGHVILCRIDMNFEFIFEIYMIWNASDTGCLEMNELCFTQLDHFFYKLEILQDCFTIW